MINVYKLILFISLMSLIAYGQDVSKANDYILIKGGCVNLGCSQDVIEKIAIKYESHWRGTLMQYAAPSIEKIPSYYMLDHEVTNGEYMSFLNDITPLEAMLHFCQDCGEEYRIEFENGTFVVEEGYLEYPVVFVNYYDALAYCAWKGSTLPTYKQFKYAYDGGSCDSEYIFSGSDDISEVGVYNEGGPSRVKSRNSNELGIFDLTANVAEWTNTLMDTVQIKSRAGLKTGLIRLTNGHFGIEKEEYCTEVTGFSAFFPHVRNSFLGFRCVREVKK